MKKLYWKTYLLRTFQGLHAVFGLEFCAVFIQSIFIHHRDSILGAKMRFEYNVLMEKEKS